MHAKGGAENAGVENAGAITHGFGLAACHVATHVVYFRIFHSRIFNRPAGLLEG